MGIGGPDGAWRPWKGETALDRALHTNRVEAVAYLRDDLGALRGKAVRRRKVMWTVLYLRAAKCLLRKFAWAHAIAQARVDFARGGAGADQAAASFAVAAAIPSQAPPPPPLDDDEPPAKRGRTH